MTSEHVLVDEDGGVLVVTLNRPEVLNAVTAEMLDRLIEVFGEADRSDAVRAVVVTGAGRAYCAGADVSAGGARFDYTAVPRSEHRDHGGQVTLAVHACRKPVIGAINGAAVGFGASHQLAFDVRLASTRARVGFVYARRGIVPEGLSTWFLPRLVGMGKALEWMSSGRLVDPPEALAAGLFNAVYEPDDLLPAALELAREIATSTSAVSGAIARRMLWRGLATTDPFEAHLLESRMMYDRGASGDAREGVESFLGKRPPEFPGSVSDEFPAELL